LAVGHAIIRRLAKPARGGRIVRPPVDSLGIKHGKIVYRLGAAGFASGAVEPPRRFEVLLHPEPLLIEAPQPELRRHETVLGSTLEPLRRFREILRDAASFGITLRDLVLRVGVAFGGGRTQVGSEGRRKLLGRRRRDRRGVLSRCGCHRSADRR
jgi:hypothetical protein